MPIVDPAAQAASLDNDYGATHGSHAPASHELCLWVGDPTLGGTEMANTTEVDDGAGGTTVVSNGYAPVTLTNDATWAAATTDALKATAAPVVFADATAEWPDVATHGVLRDPATGYLWDAFPLSEPITVTDAGPVPTVTPQIFFESWLDQS